MSRETNKDGGGGVERLPGKGSTEALLGAFPLMQALATGPVPLPEVKAPSLEGIEIQVPAPEDISEDELAERFHELVRAHATFRDRAPGEPVGLGDDVLVDILGYALGKLIPFSVRTGLWMEVGPIPALPGFGEALVGIPVESHKEIRVELPEDYPVDSLRGVPATFLVSVRAAREVHLPDPESAGFLEQAGRGETLAELMGSLVEELEQELADQLWVQAQDMVLDEVARRAGVQVPRALVDEEIRRRWGQSEGRVLGELDFKPEEQQEALDGWLSDADTRAQAERHLRVSLALRAVVEQEKLELTPEKVKEILEDAGELFDLPVDEALKTLATDTAVGQQVKNALWHLMAVGYVMDKAKIHFEGAEEMEG